MSLVRCECVEVSVLEVSVLEVRVLDVTVLEVSMLDVSVLEVSVLEMSVLEVSVLEVSMLDVSVLKVSVLEVSVLVEEGGRRKRRRRRKRSGGYSPKNKNPTRQCGEKLTNAASLMETPGCAVALVEALPGLSNAVAQASFLHDCLYHTERHHEWPEGASYAGFPTTFAGRWRQQGLRSGFGILVYPHSWVHPLAR